MPQGSARTDLQPRSAPAPPSLVFDTAAPPDSSRPGTQRGLALSTTGSREPWPLPRCPAPLRHQCPQHLQVRPLYVARVQSPLESQGIRGCVLISGESPHPPTHWLSLLQEMSAWGPVAVWEVPEALYARVPFRLLGRRPQRPPGSRPSGGSVVWPTVLWLWCHSWQVVCVVDRS